MAAHNYDGDMLTDEVAQVHRSPGFITSNLIGKREDGVMIKEYEDEFDQKPSYDEVSTSLGIPTSTLMSMIKCSSQTSLDSSIKDKAGGMGRKIAEVVADNRNPNVEDLLDSVKIKGVMRKALSSLTSREENIIRLRFGIGESEPENTDNFKISKSELNKIQEVSK